MHCRQHRGKGRSVISTCGVEGRPSTLMTECKEGSAPQYILTAFISHYSRLLRKPGYTDRGGSPALSRNSRIYERQIEFYGMGNDFQMEFPYLLRRHIFPLDSAGQFVVLCLAVVPHQKPSLSFPSVQKETTDVS
jgi:hypothetical protein